MKLVIYPPADAARLEKITASAAPMAVVNAGSEADALREIADADAFFGKITAPLLAAAQQLRWVQSPTASLEHFVFPELIAHPCQLTNMRGIFSDVIADHVFAFILCFARNLHHYLRRQQEARWEPVGGEEARSGFTLGPSQISSIDRAHIHLSDTTLGVFGLGHIGAEIARRGLAFSMRVVAVDPYAAEAPPRVEGPWAAERLPELLAQSDFVVIAAPHTPETEKLFNRGLIRQMKKSAYLINIGRGVIVDLADLTAALEAGEIAGAALDVCEIEPLPADHPLWKMENVIITPHIAAASRHIAERHLGVILDNVRRFANGDDLLNVVDKAKWF